MMQRQTQYGTQGNAHQKTHLGAAQSKVGRGYAVERRVGFGFSARHG
jgi:hypothetical protein